MTILLNTDLATQFTTLLAELPSPAPAAPAASSAQSEELRRSLDLNESVCISLSGTAADTTPPVAPATAEVDYPALAARSLSRSCPSLCSPDGQLTYVLTGNTNIGRALHNDLVLTDKSVSRLQCRIWRQQGEYYLLALNGSNFPQLNGEQADNYQPRNAEDVRRFPLHDGDKLTIGCYSLIFLQPESAPPAAAPAAPVDPDATVY